MSWIIYVAISIIDMIRLIIRLAIKWFIIEKTLLVPIFDIRIFDVSTYILQDEMV